MTAGACYGCGQPGRLFPHGAWCLACRPAEPAPGRYCLRVCYGGCCPPPAPVVVEAAGFDAVAELGHLPGRCGGCGWHMQAQGHRPGCAAAGVAG